MAGQNDKKEKEHFKNLEEVIYPEIEPGIINKKMIENAYLEEDHKGEAARLHCLEPVEYERVTKIRLEFKNILRIDHLWILPNLTKLSLNCNKIETIENIEMLVNLKELNLSFNYIEKIENLDKLVNLEVLSLFNNLLTRIENLDALGKLVILSLGNNLIETIEGIERFRFFKDLRVLNLEGNPIAMRADFSMAQYVAAILPNVQYYDYVIIKDEARELAKERYYRELREIEGNEEMELNIRAQRAKEKRDAERLSSSFVEHLNEHQLYESLWKGDDDGRILMSIGPAATDLAEEYDKDMYEVTQEIYKFGLEQYEEREKELKEFISNLNEGQGEIQRMGQKIIEEFLKYKESVFEKATTVLTALEKRNLRGEDEESPESIELIEEYEKIHMEFEDSTNDIWQQLMSQELHLHESVEETTVTFQRKMQEMIGKFVEQEQLYFGQVRDLALHFSENMSEIVTSFVAVKLALQDFEDILPELRACMEDRDALMNLVAGMKDTHIQRIDEREDRLIVRSKEFLDNLIDNLHRDELERNRDKILEINTFLDLMTESLGNLHTDIHELLMNEEN